MKFFRWLKQWIEPVYCEDCVHAVPGQGHHKDDLMCKATLLVVDCSDKDTYVNKKRKIKIIKTYESCESVRKEKSMPLSYSSTCWKFDKKPLTNEKNVI